MSTANTEIALMKKDIEYVKETMARMETAMTKFIESAEGKYVTKDENDRLEGRINKHDEVISRLGWAVFWGFTALIGSAIGITKFM